MRTQGKRTDQEKRKHKDEKEVKSKEPNGLGSTVNGTCTVGTIGECGVLYWHGVIWLAVWSDNSLSRHTATHRTRTPTRREHQLVINNMRLSRRRAACAFRGRSSQHGC